MVTCIHLHIPSQHFEIVSQPNKSVTQKNQTVTPPLLVQCKYLFLCIKKRKRLGFCLCGTVDREVQCYAINTKVMIMYWAGVCWFAPTGILGRLHLTEEILFISAIYQKSSDGKKRPWSQSQWYMFLPKDNRFFSLIVLLCFRGYMNFKEKLKEFSVILEYLEGNFMLLLPAKLSVWFSETCLIPMKLIAEW